MAGAEEIGGVGGVSGGEVGFGDEGHTQTPGEAAGGVGGVSAPEFNVVKAVDAEVVGPGVGPDELLEAHQFEFCMRRCGIIGGGVGGGGGGDFFTHFMVG